MHMSARATLINYDYTSLSDIKGKNIPAATSASPIESSVPAIARNTLRYSGY
ncbi:hypothetical protein V1506DRAFT_546931 [Lipomyces tetrasporus]